MRFTRHAAAAMALLALLCVLLGRGLAPSDTDDKDQPITMTYTVNMIENGQWVVPHDHRGNLTTKPLLYNWLAAPAVWVAGVNSELAHRLPSVLALIACFALMVWLGQRIDGSSSGILGWLTGTLFLANYTIFQLGYLARTDMLLTFWLLLGWVLATHLIARAISEAPHGDAVPAPDSSTGLPSGALRAAFWVCVALAALTKGPPALVLIVYALLAPRLLVGRWSATAVFGWWWGLLLALAPSAAWLYGVWVYEPEHLIGQLWGEEVFGRVTGLGDEGNRTGPREFFYRLFHMPLYYFSRFLPWSLLSIFAAIRLLERDDAGRRVWRALQGRCGVYLAASLIMVAVILGVFTLSTGKRAAYIAAAYGPGSLLAAWWVLAIGSRRLTTWLPYVAMGVGLLIIAVMIVYRWKAFS